MLSNKSTEFLRPAGGKWFLNTKFLLLVTPLVVTTSLLSAGSSAQPLNLSIQESAYFYLQLVIANVVALIICAIWVVGFSRTLFSHRNEKPLPIWIVVIFSAGVGALKGAATGYTSWLLQIEPELGNAISSRVWQTTLLAVWLLPALALVAARLESLQIQRDALVAERVNSLLMQSGAAQNELNRSALKTFAVLAKNELFKISTQTFGPMRNIEYARVIRKLVSEELRPLSHRIWDQENKKISSFSFSDTIKQSIMNFTDTRGLVSIVYAITALPSILRFVSFEQALLRSLLSGALIYLGFSFAAWYRPKKYWQATLWFLTVCALVAIGGFFLGSTVFGFVAGFRANESVLAVFLWVCQIAFFSSFLAGVRREGADINGELSIIYGSDSIEKAARFTQSRIQNRDFANYLHGTVQNKLLSIALGLEKGGATKEELERALSMVTEILTGIDKGVDSADVVDLEAGLDKHSMQWSGFISITWQLDQRVHSLPSRTRILILQVVDEALANSVRHGLCKTIFVELKVTNDGVTLEVLDDGIGPRKGLPGLGTSLYQSASRGKWSLSQQTDGGSKLTVHF